MKIKVEKHISSLQLLWNILFICMPTIFLIYYLLKISGSVSLFNLDYIYVQTAYFAIGIILSTIFHSYKFRFLPALLIILVVFFGINKALDTLALGEFDSFFFSIEFLVFRVLFLFGWVSGWGLVRLRLFSIVLVALFLVYGAFIIATVGDLNFNTISLNLLPIIFFSFYIIYMGELIRNINDQKENSWKKIIKGFIIYFIGMALILASTFLVFRTSFASIERQLNRSGEKDEFSMYDKQEDGTVKMKDNLEMKDKQNKGGSSNSENDNIPIFVTYLDNFFPNTSIPNPLYYVTDYLTKFDDYTETFEKDDKMPYNDLFSPDPSKLDLYFPHTDSTVLAMGMSTMYRRVVEAEIYQINASPSEFAAPSTAFSCQPIAVKSDLKDQFRAAYKAKMWVSDLNSGYFVYNNTKRDIKFQSFQERRFEILRNVKDYSEVDEDFVKYYTQFPENNAYDTLISIANDIVENANARTPIDKVLAVRDFYMETDETGKAIFSYTDTPGPIPSGSRLLNFLLNDHKGYCAHYAGSTLFLLRALGIPSRLATGYAIVDRSSNNKGWYWVYAKQSHAWVQVFFPEYGWLDFDTTFGETDREEAPGTDGTPPLFPQKAWFAGIGDIVEIDTVENSLMLSLEKLMYNDVEFILDTISDTVRLDMSGAKIFRDSMEIKLSGLKISDLGLAISYDEPHNTIELYDSIQIGEVLANVSELQPISISEFKVSDKKTKERQEQKLKETEDKDKGTSWLAIVIIIAIILLIIGILILSIPFIIYKTYSQRAKKIKNAEEGFFPYQATMLMLHQMGYLRNELTPLQYARKIDEEFDTNFEAFTATYLKSKYAQQSLSVEESERILSFYKPFKQFVKAKVGTKKWTLSFLNLHNTINFFTKE